LSDTLHTLELRRDDRVMVLRRPLVRLEVVRGPDARLSRDFDLDRIAIGSDPRCDLVLSDPAVSRQHAELVMRPGGCLVRDLDSTNGTFYHDARLGQLLVDRAALLRLGNTQVRIAPQGATVDLPLAPVTSFGALKGRSAAMRRVFDLLARVAPTDTTVLLLGESGTGKELAARAVHEASRRARGPFVVVDCGALPPTLIESELYGHERGAFTGALRQRTGAFEAAGGGTLFLDEVGELPLELQTRLLGALERRQVQRLGSSEARAIDVRVVAATNRDLRRELSRGAFREDLFFRLAVVTVELPPLRERPEDVALYAEEFLGEMGAEGLSFTLDPATIEELARQPWPGNVRELRNALERAAALGELHPPPIDPESAAPATTGFDAPLDAPFKVSKAMLVDQFEARYMAELVARHSHNLTRAARAAEIDRVYLLRLLDKHGIPRRPG
jgi:DNA-binding NtrC family response regulator